MSAQLINSDIVENDFDYLDQDLLDILLFDRSSNNNIIWATDDYANLGDSYKKKSPIRTCFITETQKFLLQPRAAKPLQIQQMRIRNKGEVFTPSWMCNLQNNLVDEAWFGYKDVFNKADERTWVATEGRISFPSKSGDDWRTYIDSRRLEITCGEAPYLASRYDTTTGVTIPLRERIGLLDRKLRVVGENVSTKADWLQWAIRAMQSIYGYEFMGDSLLLARINVFMTFIEYFFDRFREYPDSETQNTVAEIVSWNLWQMDGLKGVIPFSCRKIVRSENSLLGNKTEILPCPGCSEKDYTKHTGIYCNLMDWSENKSIKYIDLLEG